MEKALVKRGVIKIIFGLVVLIVGGWFVYDGVRDVKLGILSDDPNVGVNLVKGEGCCKVCGGDFCKEICNGDEVDPRLLIKPVKVCGNHGCRELKEGDPLKCEE